MTTSGPERSYRSPLRDAQAAQTRTLILETMTEMLARDGAATLSVRQLATEAGVSERTVYRYFPDRESLLEGLNDYVTMRLGTGRGESELASLDELIEYIPVVFRSFDEMPEVTKAGVLLNPDPATPVGTQRRRSELMIELTRKSLPELSDHDAVRLGQAIRTVSSTYSWLRMREEFGMDGEESGRLLAWILQTAIDEARRTGRLGPEPV